MRGALEMLCGGVLPLLLLVAGGCFAVWLLPTFRLRRGGEGRGSAGALAVALAGTLGVGNIAGVATALLLGGAGAIFWMWVSALFAMLLKYAEVVLAVRFRVRLADGSVRGGAYYYMKRAFTGQLGRALGALFAVLCVLCSLLLGGVIQSAAATEAMREAFGVPPLFMGLSLGVLAALLLAGTSRGVERACGVIVPLTCLLFVGVSVLALALRWEGIPAAFGAILQGAFSLRSGVGGALGFLNLGAVRYGVSRGLVSNEAGCGTAPIAHAAAEVSHPAQQGLWGILEVFVDTVLLCTLTALVLLVSGIPGEGEGGMHYAIAAYGAILGEMAAPWLSISVLLFAFATVLCWSHYGAQALCYLTGRCCAPRLHPVAVALACVLGALLSPRFIWEVTDALLALMALLNVAVLLTLRREVQSESQRYFRK